MAAKKDEPLEWIVMGRVIGTATGWDQSSDWDMQLYNFVPATTCPTLIAGDPCIMFEQGRICYYDDQGQETLTLDLIDATMHAERKVR